MAKISVLLPGGNQRIVEFDKQECLLNALEAAKIEISSSCGGMGSCGTCLVEVVLGSDSIHMRNELEAEMAEARGFTNRERLACQICPQSNISIRIKGE